MTIRRNLIGGSLLASFVLASARVNALPPPPPTTASKLAPVPSIFGNKIALPTPRLRRKISIRNFQMVTPRSGWVLDTDRLSWYDESIATTISIAPSGVDPDRIVALTIDATGSGVLAFVNDDERSISTMTTATFGKTWSATGVTSLTSMYSSFDIASVSGHVYLAAGTQNANFSYGELFAFEGARWVRRGVTPVAGKLSATDGRIWLTGGSDRSHLYSSVDEGKTWHEETFAGDRQYGLPRSSDKAHASVLSLLFDEPADTSVWTDWVTADGGATWTRRGDRRVTGRSHVRFGASFPDGGATLVTGTNDVARFQASKHQRSRR